MDLPKKIANTLSSTKWYHATTKSNFKNILTHGVSVDFNRYGELDFGYGFYLTTTEKLAESYISRLFSWKGECAIDPPVIMEYEMSPIDWFTSDNYKTAVFPEFNDAFAEFVFKNRTHSSTGLQCHNYDAVYGVMSDSAPTTLLLKYRANELCQEDVLQGLKKGNSMKQISLHNQALCDIICLRRAYQYNPETQERTELSIYE